MCRLVCGACCKQQGWPTVQYMTQTEGLTYSMYCTVDDGLATLIERVRQIMLTRIIPWEPQRFAAVGETVLLYTLTSLPASL